MATKKKKKPELVLVGALVPVDVALAVKAAGAKEDRSVSSFLRILIERAPQVKAALREIAA